MEDGVYPRLTLLARERRDLCGPKGKLFEPYKGELVAALSEEDIRRAQRLIRRATEGDRRVSTKQPNFGHKKQEHRDRDRVQAFRGNPTRKPYKVN